MITRAMMRWFFIILGLIGTTFDYNNINIP
jgi:hypothetical protein